MKILGFEIRRAKTPATRFLGDLVKVQLSPGDVCILMTRHALPREEVASVTASWRATVGEDVTLIVLDDGMKLGVLSPPQAAAIHQRLADAEAVSDAVEKVAAE